MNRQEAEVIASAVAIMRPEWQQGSMVTLLAKLQHRPARQVALALVALAYDHDVTSPGLLLKDGAHWAVGTIGEPTYTPPALSERLCPTHGDRLTACRGCAADRKAAPTEASHALDARQPGETLIQWARRCAGEASA